MNSKKIRTIGAVVLALLVLVYVGYQAYLATHRSIQTETAMYGEASDVLQAQGFVIRNESVIDETYSGVLSYRVADGTRVSQGGVIADVYASEEDVTIHREIEQLDREIENLQALSQPADYFVANPTMLSDQIYSAVEEIEKGVNQNNYSDLASWKENLLTALTRRQLITGAESAEDYAQPAGKPKGRPGEPGGIRHRHHSGAPGRILYQRCGRAGKRCGCGKCPGADRLPGRGPAE